MLGVLEVVGLDMSAVPLVIPFDVWLVETLADHVETTNLSRSNQASLGSAFMNVRLCESFDNPPA